MLRSPRTEWIDFIAVDKTSVCLRTASSISSAPHSPCALMKPSPNLRTTGLATTTGRTVQPLPSLAAPIASGLEACLLPQDIEQWRSDLQARLDRIQQHPEQGLGFIEEHGR